MNEDACETKYNSFTKKAQNESEACGTGLELMTGEKVARKGKKIPSFPQIFPWGTPDFNGSIFTLDFWVWSLTV